MYSHYQLSYACAFYWIQVAQNRVKWQVVVSKVMALWAPYNGEILEQT